MEYGTKTEQTECEKTEQAERNGTEYYGIRNTDGTFGLQMVGTIRNTIIRYTEHMINSMHGNAYVVECQTFPLRCLTLQLLLRYPTDLSPFRPCPSLTVRYQTIFPPPPPMQLLRLLCKQKKQNPGPKGRS